LHEMPQVCGIFSMTLAVCSSTLPICHSWGSRSQVVAKPGESGEPVFTSMDVLFCGLYSSFKTANFYTEKRVCNFYKYPMKCRFCN
jgi:hypothetical protein